MYSKLQHALVLRLVWLVPDSSASLLLGFSAILSVSLVSRLTAIEICTIMCLGVKRRLASGHEISRLQHGLQLIMARYTRIINCRPCCNLYILPHSHALGFQYLLEKFSSQLNCGPIR